MLRGSAFLALWNDVDPDRRAEYEDWHAVEHVPERVGIEGFLSGRRCVSAGVGNGRRYFTLYELESLAVLQGAAYAEVVNEPTEWSRSMRPSLRNVTRRACSTLVSFGAGAAKIVGTVELPVPAPAEHPLADVRAAAAAALSPLVDASGLVGLHLGIEDEAAAATHPLHGAWTESPIYHPTWERRFVLLVEGTDADEVRSRMDAATRVVGRVVGGEAHASAPVAYEVATWVERSHLPPSPGRQPPRPDRQGRWPTR